MNIKDVKTAFKIADVVLDKKHKQNHIKINFLPEIIDERGKKLEKSILKNNVGRVYIIVVDRIIKKIGGSQSKGGIKATLSFYQSAMQGGPSLRSYGIHLLITEVLKKDKTVEIYMITSQTVKAAVKGLFSEEKKDTNVFKEMENKCKEDYKKIEGDFPEWNYQERAAPWPKKIHKSYVKFLTKRVKNR
ncbi:hypothetical protein KJ636_04350 [Patescibacteria group bacterium]|nr:hypothetical protein [Patescibacteria group bacterium]MBU4481763.1 hypothetical protein [Patescibacteria group bacterium]